ncbi:MAG: sigma-70 family RNA polymerase sigma factor [Proteobacteria bacterium]|nr:sigma-70 family RNA polymerase sigma factor [Pseudomonadota bacterium]
MIPSVTRKTGADTGERQALADEAELIQRCLTGDRAAQEDFYRRYRRIVAGNLYRVLNDGCDLEDLIQEVFVVAFRGLPRFRGEARISTWLYRICVNIALGKIRSSLRRPQPIPMADPEPDRDATVSGPETPERILQRRQDRERVYRVLETLAPKKRVVLYLHEIEGRDLKEVAYLVGAHPVTVRTRLFYARKEFYRRLAQWGDDGTSRMAGRSTPADNNTPGDNAIDKTGGKS